MKNQNAASVEKIITLVANLPDICVQEVFQEIGRMPPITIVVLHHMGNVLTDIFEESRVVVSPKRRSNRLSSKQRSSGSRRKRAGKAKKGNSESDPDVVIEEEEASSEDDSYDDEEGLPEPARKAPSKPKVRNTYGAPSVTGDYRIKDRY